MRPPSLCHWCFILFKFNYFPLPCLIFRELVVTPTQKHWINILFNIIEILNKKKIWDFVVTLNENYWISILFNIVKIFIKIQNIVLFYQVGVTRKFSKPLLFIYCEFTKYFDDVKYKYDSMLLSQFYKLVSIYILSSYIP